MTPRIVAVSTLLALLPATAFAQTANTLGDPNAPIVAPTPSATPALAATPAWAATPAPVGVDPEITQLRSAEPTQVRASASGESSWVGQNRIRTPGYRRGPNFWESWGHAWAGFGIGTAGGGALGATMGCAVTAIFGGCPWGAMYGAPVGAMALSPVGAALGAWGWGELAGGTGNFFASLGLSFLGASMGVATAWAITDGTQSGWGALLGPLVGAIMSTLGAAIGYQASSHGSADDGLLEEPLERGFVWAPTIAPTENSDGATVGVAGAF